MVCHYGIMPMMIQDISLKFLEFCEWENVYACPVVFTDDDASYHGVVLRFKDKAIPTVFDVDYRVINTIDLEKFKSVRKIDYENLESLVRDGWVVNFNWLEEPNWVKEGH